MQTRSRPYPPRLRNNINLLLVCLTLLYPFQLHAMCLVPSLQEATEQALVVFTGSVTGISASQQTATLSVDRYFKGSGASTVTLGTASSAEIRIEDESIAFQVGKKYLVFVSGTRARDGLWMAGECSGSRPIQAFGSEIRDLR